MKLEDVRCLSSLMYPLRHMCGLRIRLQNSKHNLYMVCDSFGVVASPESKIFQTQPVKKHPESLLPEDGWEFMDDVTVLNCIVDRLRKYRDNLSDFEHTVLSYKVKPFITVPEAEVLVKLYDNMYSVKPHIVTPQDGCCFLVFSATETKMFLLYYSRSLYYSLSDYPGNVGMDAFSEYYCWCEDYRRYKYKIASDTGLLITKETIALDKAENNLYELINKFNELSNECR